MIAAWLRRRRAERLGEILCVLRLREMTARQIAFAVDRRPGSLYPDLARLERAGVILRRVEDVPPGMYARHLYRRADES